MRVALIQARITDANTFLTPLGLLYIAAYLRRQEHQVIVLDQDCDVNDPMPLLSNFQPEVIGFSVMTTYYRRTDRMIRKIRKELPGAVICAGGIHPSALPERTVQELGGGLDFIIRGEGELTLTEVLRRMEAGEDIHTVRGTYFYQNAKLTDNGRAEACPNLDLLPFPARDLLDMSKYMTYPGFIKGIPLEKTTNLISSRGCPAQCIYCGNQVLFDRNIRKRSADNVIGEIESLVENYNIGGFGFSDDNFMADSKRVVEFCEKLIDKKWNLKWVCSTRALNIKEDLTRLMYRAGCRQYEIGVESGSDKILKYMKKGLTTEQIAEGYDIAKKNGMRRMASFIIGFPTETEEDIKLTEKFAKKIKPDFASFFFLTPYPGTELYSMALKNGWIPEKHEFGEDWTIRQAEEPLMAIEFTPKQLKFFRAHLQNAFFWKNFFSGINIPFYSLMAWSLLVNPKILFKSVFQVIKTRRFDYLAESALAAYRYKIEKCGRK
ncbi:MAG: Radical SAM domain protein [Candidatus Uhrbacteria bacterium GW2011_GWF2_39_13]|uniref:Radical SAM domain protein n=1 Tax=Candidatus Uhrbacteria bacterium GW2011_GWF2_39_13 TaxID=1618995 RepID=A0A0G0MIJ4_9BACT|nr:MAG: Radical SAM domain protein [Candidatus Uhrbacteria bacterium GW2011_GWF2_39_13]